MKIKIKFKKKKIGLKAKRLSSIGEIFGLMFKTRNTENLFFHFPNRNSSIHSFFVFFSFLAIWLDKKNKVTDFKIIKPFTFHVSSEIPSEKLVELPLNAKNAKLIKFFVGKAKV